LIFFGCDYLTFAICRELAYICQTTQLLPMMRKLLIIALFGLSSIFASAQNLAISPSIVAPSSGCNLSSSSIIQIIIVNVLGSPYAGTFDISYSLNGAPAITETYGPFVMGGSTTFSYSFIALADLSACQVHTLDFVLTVAGDVDLSNNVYSGTITSDCAPTPGFITTPDTVCSGINSGNLVLWGYTGNPENWIYSTTGGAPWTWLPNTTATQPYSNINTEMLWWVLMGSPYGYCPDDSTEVDTIRTVAQTNAGTLPVDFDICDNGNGGMIVLTGHVGDVLNWGMSQDGGVTWATIPNTTDSQPYTNLNDTTMYQVQVQNTAFCPAYYTTPLTMNLIPGSDAGSIVGELLVCNFENDSSLEVNPVLGTVVDWAMSTDNGTSWFSTGTSDTLLPYAGLLSYTLFAVFVQEANCPYDTTYHSIVVLPLGVNAGPDISIFEEDSTQLNATGGSFFYWYPSAYMSDPNISNPVVWPEFTTTYNVQVTDINGCTDTASVTVTVLPNIFGLLIPNLLTPNGDNYNDYLNIPNIDTYPDNELHIFNSYGQVIYEAQPYTNDWYATYGGSNLPDGTYYYILDLHNEIIAPDPIQGVITILGND